MRSNPRQALADPRGARGASLRGPNLFIFMKVDPPLSGQINVRWNLMKPPSYLLLDFFRFTGRRSVTISALPRSAASKCHIFFLRWVCLPWSRFLRKVSALVYRGTPQTHASRGSKFSQFHAVFGKILQNRMVASPLPPRVCASSWENPGSAPALFVPF